MLTDQQLFARRRLNAMARVIEGMIATSMDMLITEAVHEGCFVAGPPDEFGQPCFDLPNDLHAIRQEMLSQSAKVIGAITDWTGKRPDMNPGVTP